MTKAETLELLEDLARLQREDKLEALLVTAVTKENRTILHIDTDESATLQTAYHLLGVTETAAFSLKGHINANLNSDDES